MYFQVSSVLLLWLGCVTADISGSHPPAGSCLCLYYTGVNVRDAPCGAVIGSSSSPACFTSGGSKVGCSLSGTWYEWFDVDYGARTAWIAGTFLQVGEASRCAGYVPPAGDCSRVQIVSRAEWGARPPAYNIPNMNLPVTMSFIHHTVTNRCTDQATCSSIMRSVQNYHMDSQGWPDIAYNFLVGEDGRAYEGRGWSKVGAHTLGYNDNAVAVCVIGDFTGSAPNEAASNAVANILDCAVKGNYLTSGYEMFGHRDGGYTACPGDSFYPVLQKWPHYSFRDIPKYPRKVGNRDEY